MSIRLPRAVLAALTVTALAGAAAPALATAAPNDPPAGKVSAHTFAKQAEARTYWTPERMKKAKNRTLPRADKGRAGVRDTTGTPATNQGAKPAAPTVASALPQAAKPTVGRVFFTLGGADYVCSANSVSSRNGSVVSTAGHCVNEGPGAYAERFVFVPAYDNGRAPYGQWAGVRAFTPDAWSSRGDMNMDTAFVVVAPKSGTTLANRVGSTGVAFNQSRGLRYTSYGYPAASPHNGQTLWSCTGTAFANPVDRYSTSQGIPCTMTGGSSGGPWFIGTGGVSSSSVQNSVNSFGYPSLGDYMFGPYWGTTIQSSWSAASNASVN